MKASPPRRTDIALLLRVLGEPASATSLSGAEWDLLVRAARRAKLLATVHARLASCELLSHIPKAVVRHLEGAHALAIYRRSMALHLLEGLRAPLRECLYPIVLLKGTAYIAQNLEVANGRIFADVDVMVPKADLDDAESRFITAGWRTTLPDAYDQHYYRHWSHELPPMSHPGHPLTLDLHHAILPITGTANVDTAALFTSAISLPGTPWKVLSPPDQIMHASAHLFQDSDCGDRLRDLVDIDSLLREHGQSPGFWTGLMDRALSAPTLGRPLWYALRYCHDWLGTPVPSDAQRALAVLAPPAPVRLFMDLAMTRVLGGPHPDALSPFAAPLWSWAMKSRAMLLRMPPYLLVYHALRKSVRRR